VEGFRSLKSVRWKPGRLNVLIGPNGGGKSNLLSALELIRVSARGELRKRILQQGGMHALAWNGEGAIRFRVRNEPELGQNYDYDFTLGRVGSSGLHIVTRERLMARDGSVLIDRLVPDNNPQETLLSFFRSVAENPIDLFRNFISKLDRISKSSS
jgi:predicted ATPase